MADWIAKLKAQGVRHHPVGAGHVIDASRVDRVDLTSVPRDVELTIRSPESHGASFTITTWSPLPSSTTIEPSDELTELRIEGDRRGESDLWGGPWERLAEEHPAVKIVETGVSDDSGRSRVLGSGRRLGLELDGIEVSLEAPALNLGAFRSVQPRFM